MSNDRIEKQVELAAPVTRVWRALTDHREFGAWFRVDLEGPFEVGKTARGRVTYPGYEHLTWHAVIEAIEPERRFAFSWHPAGIDPQADYSNEPTTLVEFLLEETAAGTRLTLIESGFDRIPANRRTDAVRLNDEGWTEQVKNIAAHVAR